MDDLVSTGWLAQELSAPDLVVLDASSHLPMRGRDARAEFEGGHIPGARFLDLATLVDQDSDVPAAIPTAAQLAERLGSLGVSNDARVVLYDDSAVKTAARAWFILRRYGVDVAILDGGLAKWTAEDRALESGGVDAAPASFSASDGTGSVASRSDVLANTDSADRLVLDARDAKRFSGALPDFRPNVARGHIPGSANLPFDRVLNDDGTYKSHEELRAILTEAGVDERPVTTTCGSGVTASVLLFALHLAGRDDVALYDGSWGEWGADPATPKSVTAQPEDAGA